MNSDRFVIRKTGQDLTVYDSEKDEVHILNRTAGAIFSLCREGKTEEEIVSALRAAYLVEEGQDLEAEVGECIDSLIKTGVLEGSRWSLVVSKDKS